MSGIRLMQVGGTFAKKPDPPTIGAATRSASQTVSVSFTAGSNGGSPITGFTVTASPGGATGTGSSSPVSVAGLTNGTAYTFTVTATNSIGTSDASSSSNSATPFTTPGAPTGQSATGAGSTAASVSFSAPASNGGSAITNYVATASPGGATGSSATSPITVSGLSTGTAYTFTVVAQNAAGNGTASGSTNSVTPAGPVVFTYYNNNTPGLFTYSFFNGFLSTYSNPPNSDISTRTDHIAAFSPDGNAVMLGGDSSGEPAIKAFRFGAGYGTKFSDPGTINTISRGGSFNPGGGVFAEGGGIGSAGAWNFSPTGGWGSKYATATGYYFFSDKVNWAPTGDAIAANYSTVARWSGGWGTVYSAPPGIPSYSSDSVQWNSTSTIIGFPLPSPNHGPIVNIRNWSTSTGFGSNTSSAFNPNNSQGSSGGGYGFGLKPSGDWCWFGGFNPSGHSAQTGSYQLSPVSANPQFEDNVGQRGAFRWNNAGNLSVFGANSGGRVYAWGPTGVTTNYGGPSGPNGITQCDFGF